MMNRSHLFKIIVIFILAISLINAAHAEVIYESATMGPTGQTEGYLIDSYGFMGSRFYIGNPVQVTAIGGHLFAGWPEDDIFGAIVRLDGLNDLPNGFPFVSGDVVAYTLFTPNYPSSDFRAQLSVLLEPGYYGLVFGSGLYGATGSAYMPNGGQSDMTGATYFLWDGYYDYSWYDAAPFQGRFVVEGTVIISSGYCAASAACDEYISGVQVGSINNTGTSCSGGYASYTTMETTMEIGKSYTITVTNGYPYPEDRCGIWVDWNQDFDFTDAGETITVSGNPGLGPYTATITPPAGAVLGKTRLRIRIVYDETPLSCGAADWGETEDYTINVTNLGRVDFEDIAELSSQWLFEKLTADVMPPGGNGIVNFDDFTVLADQWGITAGVPELVDFTEQWLKIGLPSCSADIAPLPNGDGRVDFVDFALMADNWLQ
jgi:hypothetical protein